jgi:serine/threonine protein phosphatase PrpC
MKFDVYSYTNRGGRDYNEDFCNYWQESSKGAFVLADGLGGHGHGEVASELAVNYIINASKKNFRIDDEILIELIDGANSELMSFQTQKPEYKNIRTTIAAALFSEDVFKYINVGDSRLYFFKNGCLYAQSKDHSVPQMAVELGEIRAEDIRRHEDRSKLLKVLGDVRELNIKKAEPGIKIYTGDAFIICTDGFWEYVLETEMEIDLLKSSSAKEWCEFMCKRLLRRVPGDNDNFTVMCAIMSEPVIATSWIPPPPSLAPTQITYPVTANPDAAATVSAAPTFLSRRMFILLSVLAALLIGFLVLKLLPFGKTTDEPDVPFMADIAVELPVIELPADLPIMTITPPATEPPVTEPPETEPPETAPPVTTATVTEPPVAAPPITTTTVTEPPVTEPPVAAPPMTEPPVTEEPEEIIDIPDLIPEPIPAVPEPVPVIEDEVV